MADIIDFRTKRKPRQKSKNTDHMQNKPGQIILFSGVRIEREENSNHNIQVNDTQVNEVG